MTRRRRRPEIGELNWWRFKARPFVCVYCGLKTTGAESAEHIVPESLGCKATLYAGAVCTGCNHRLGTNVDNKIFREGLFAAGQIAADVPGKAGPRERLGNAISTGPGSAKVAGGVSGGPNAFTTGRAIAKCAVNILVSQCGSERTRTWAGSIVNYVAQPATRADIWPFAAEFVVSSSEIPCKARIIWREGQPAFGAAFCCSSGFFATVLDRTTEKPGADASLVLEEGRRYFGINPAAMARFSQVEHGSAAASRQPT